MNKEKIKEYNFKGIYGREKSNVILRRSILIFLDIFIFFISIKINSNILNLNNKFTLSNAYGEFILFTILFGIFIYLTTGQYRGISRYIGSSSFYQLAGSNFLLVTAIYIYGIILNLEISVYYIFTLYLLLIFFTGSWRILLRDAIQKFKILNRDIKKVAIYGAGSAGAQLEASLRLSNIYKISYFIDDDPSLVGRSLNGIKIINPIQLSKYKSKLDKIFLAIPSIKNSERKILLKNIQRYNLPILQIPSIDEITSGKASINTLRPVMIEDLLGRETVLKRSNILGQEVNNKNICITGAGGSIGAELCKEIYKLKPKKLILFEISEPSLYKICKELSLLNNTAIELKPILGNCLDQNFMESTFYKENVNIIFHAAAYKHVPLVEINPRNGILNNVFSTLFVSKAAVNTGVKKVILISSDKAVRPTNVMGASKRLSELIIQAFADDKAINQSTKFSMVRFGNVLGSSGSVVPLFRKQIALGGPVTITDKNVTRYFMTIQEASNLVLQAASLAKGGEVFILKMGNPVKIVDLAKQMISLNGLSIKSNSNPKGDIEIKFTGLRPGEKLYEELLIDAKSKPTIHPLIFMANERFIPKEKLIPILTQIERDLKNNDVKKVFKEISELIPEWKIEIKNFDELKV